MTGFIVDDVFLEVTSADALLKVLTDLSDRGMDLSVINLIGPGAIPGELEEIKLCKNTLTDGSETFDLQFEFGEG